MRDLIKATELTRFETHLSCIYDVLLFKGQFYIISATDINNGTKYLIRKAYEEDYADIMSIWSFHGNLIDIVKSDDVDLEGGLFYHKIPLLITPSVKETLQCWDICNNTHCLLWEIPNCWGTVLTTLFDNNYIIIKAFDECSIIVIDIQLGEIILTISSEDIDSNLTDIPYVQCVGIHSQDNLMAICYSDGTIIISKITEKKFYIDLNQDYLLITLYLVPMVNISLLPRPMEFICCRLIQVMRLRSFSFNFHAR